MSSLLWENVGSWFKQRPYFAPVGHAHGAEPIPCSFYGCECRRSDETLQKEEAHYGKPLR